MAFEPPHEARRKTDRGGALSHLVDRGPEDDEVGLAGEGRRWNEQSVETLPTRLTGDPLAAPPHHGGERLLGDADTLSNLAAREVEND
jgi:hypothetical protein